MNNYYRKYSKGDMLFKEGEKPSHLFLVQSGLVSCFVHKNDKNIEICQVQKSQILGESALIDQKPYLLSAKAINETLVMALPLDLLASQLDRAPQILKILVKGLAEKQKDLLVELKDFKMDGDSSPCPMDQVAKIFGVIYHVARYTGIKDANKGTSRVVWQNFKQYAHHIFLTAPLRLEQACNILIKLKLAEAHKEVDPAKPEEPAQLVGITFNNLQAIEDFFEFYSHYFYKGSKKAALTTDEKCMKFLEVLNQVTQDARVAPNGVAQAKYIETLDKIKAQLDFAAPEYFERLEQRGLFVKRESNNQGGLILFHKEEFNKMSINWKIMREIEKWNTLGFVDMDEESKKNNATHKSTHVTQTISCMDCQGQISLDMRFCPNCGAKQNQAA